MCLKVGRISASLQLDCVKFQAGLASRAFEFFMQFSFLFMIFCEEKILKCGSLPETILSVPLSLLINIAFKYRAITKNCQNGAPWVYSECFNVQRALKLFFYGWKVLLPKSLISRRAWKMSSEIVFWKNIYYL